MMEFVWTLVGFFLTVLVFSYLFGDNPLFRIVTYLFVGVTAGYTAVIILYYVLWPRLFYPILFGTTPEKIMIIFPMLLSLLMLAKLFPRISGLGNISVGYLVGVGAAVTIGGSILGTLFSQVTASINIFENANLGTFVQGAFILFGTVSTLAYFHFGAIVKVSEAKPQRPIWIEIIAKIGQVFIAITLGALFAGVYVAALTALVDRLDFIKTTIMSFF